MELSYNYLEWILRILLACICGGLIGLERTIRLKEAGIRTHAIVAMGSAVMMIVSKYGFLDAAQYHMSFDGSRIAASVITGISFLGAGVIFVRSNSIKGLTTSAGIWTTSGIGIALGAGMYIVGLASTVILLLLQLLLHRFVGGLDSMTMNEISLTVIHKPGSIDEIKKLLSEHNIIVQKFNAAKSTDSTITFNLTVKSAKELSFDDMMDIFGNNPLIISFAF